MTKEEFFEKEIGTDTLERYVDNKVNFNTIRGLFLKIMTSWEKEIRKNDDPDDTTLVGTIREYQVINSRLKELLKQARCPSDCESGAIITKDKDGQITDVGPCNFCYERAQILEI